MNRFKFYIVTLIINIFILILGFIFKFSDFTGIINFVSFLFVVLYFLFSMEEPPKKEKLLIPQVHNYYRSRQNNVMNVLALEFGVFSMIFFIVASSTQLPVGLIVIALWIISVPIIELTIRKYSKELEFNKIVDYVSFVYPEIPRGKIQSLIKGFVSKKSINLDVLTNVKHFDKMLVENVAKAYLYYIAQIDDSLTPEEIEEINSL